MTDSEELRRRQAEVPVWYHVMDLAPDVVTPGEFDMRPYVEHYGFPKSLRGQTVVDLGASNGFFSFHMEKLGADRVVAVDLRTVADHDLPRWYVRRGLAQKTAEEMRQIDYDELEAGFELAREALGSRVEKRRHTAYELEQAMPGEFDLALCSNVLHHLRDPVDALENLRAALKPGGRLILGCSSDLTADASYAIFAGTLKDVMWWTMSKEAILRMCKLAGFVDIEWKTTFQFTPTRQPEHVGVMGIIHARAPDVGEWP